ncbi:DEAD/DEAH box helicase [Azospirillum halopraeferens]|uniref:DEAD/DEAH box helicase n=1 Tax=Azospirillum halopraeferens TaxID=34010 RepID=UPI0003F86649|nr:DEAD/DEAH box helicase [Azospirillum halopraeferens]
MAAFTEADVRRWFGDLTVRKGAAYRHEGRVRAASLSADGRTAEGQVQGTERRPYTVSVTIDGAGSPRGVQFRNACSCYLGGECKHVVAVLLDLLHRPAVTSAPAAAAESATSPAVARWLALLEDAPRQSSDGARSTAWTLLYRFDRDGAGGGLMVEPTSVQMRRDGTPATARPLSASGIANLINAYSVPNYIGNDDLEILRLVWAATGGDRAFGSRSLRGSFALPILQAVLASGRGRWQSLTSPALRPGPPVTAEGRWVADADGVQSFRFAGPAADAPVLAVTPPWYIHPATGDCGPLETGLPDRLAAALAAAPPVPPAAARIVRSALTARLPDRDALLPASFEETVRRDVTPVPVLRLWIDVGAFVDWEVVHASLLFDYDGTVVPWHDTTASVRRPEAGRFVVMPRRRDAERAAVERLGTLGFEPYPDGDLFTLEPDEEADALTNSADQELFAFLHRAAPALAGEGWRIEPEDGTLPTFVEPEDWTAEVEESTGVDWFGLSLGVTVDGQRLDLLPVLLPILRALPDEEVLPTLGTAAPDEPVFVPLGDGRLLPMPSGRLGAVLRALYELYRVGGIADDGTIRLTPARAAELADAEAVTAAAGLRWMGGERLRALGARLRGFSGIERVPVPAGLTATLRDYQRAGLDWMQFLRDYGLGGVLADDMGLGKTVQALAHILAEKEAGRLDRPCLVVAPTSLMGNWKAEAARFAPGLRTLVLHGANRKADFERPGDHDLVLTTYPLLPRDRDALLAQDWHLLILDEAQAIKNPRTKLAKVALELPARHRLCLTGTPLENNLTELWSLFHFLMPGLLGDERAFRTTFRTPIEKKGDAGRSRLLAQRVRPFLLRRTKDAVAGELPPKTEIIEHVELDGPQRDLYETIRLAMDAKVRAEVAKKGLARSHIIILEALLKLRQVCCDPRLVKLRAAPAVRTSAKLERLMELLPELVAEGRRVLLFSQFTSMLDLIAPELERSAIPFVTLTGDTRDRTTPVDRFQAGGVPVFLISLKAGGTGLNLTAADTVIHYDPWWNPAVERQATDRAHRIGQDKPVFVHKLVSVGTVEAAILDLQARKQALADALFDPDARDAAALTAEDLESLFKPISV